MNKPNLQVSFSGGRTSAYMCHWLLANKRDTYNMHFTFANTGLEHEDTLRFADRVDKEFGLNLVWLEAVVHSKERKACTHKIVDYTTASRCGEPFEAVMQKYGLPNHTFKLCTRELKANVMKSYSNSVWGQYNYETAIGIRADEPRRVSPSATDQKIIYPLVDMIPTTKQDVLEFFSQFDWDLQIPEYLGNCVTCYKKSDKKLNTIYHTQPEAFDFFIRTEDLYASIGPNVIPGPRKLFRGYRSTKQLLAQFAYLNTDSSRMYSSEESGGCSESCEVFETENPPPTTIINTKDSLTPQQKSVNYECGHHVESGRQTKPREETSKMSTVQIDVNAIKAQIAKQAQEGGIAALLESMRAKKVHKALKTKQYQAAAKRVKAEKAVADAQLLEYLKTVPAEDGQGGTMFDQFNREVAAEAASKFAASAS